MNYQKQAQDWLDANGVTMTIERGEAHNADGYTGRPDGLLGYGYRIIMRHDKREISFPFWGSAADAKQGKDPTPYDVLACISGDVHCPSTHAEFCSNYGYDPDSIKGLATFRRCYAFSRKLKLFFGTWANLETLSEIQ